MLFRAASRLHNADVYSAIFRQGQRHYLKAGMYISLANSLDIARLGVIVAKKKIRKATQRNYLKRVQREGFRKHQLELKGYDIVFVASQKIDQLCQKKWFGISQADWRLLAKRLAPA